MICPFRLGASMIILNAPRARLQGSGNPPDINIDCIGADCAMFVTTNTAEKTGACSPALLVSLVNTGNISVGSIAGRLDALTMAVAEAALPTDEAGVEIPPTRPLAARIGHALKALFADAPPPLPVKPKLEAVSNKER